MKKGGKPTPPLPVKDGIAPSRVRLVRGEWPNLYAFLCWRFAHLDSRYIQEQLASGAMVNDEGEPLSADSPYRPDSWIWYYRKVPNEAPNPFELTIIYEDEHLVVVDKPHFMATIPGGKYLKETAVIRLREMLNNQEINPIHRLDRDTAGLLLFSKKVEVRGVYQSLFQTRDIEKTYECVAPYRADLALPLTYRSYLARSDQFFVMKEYDREPNSETRITLLSHANGLGHYLLEPVTGRKHQLRAHMNALGVPILNDEFYPTLLPAREVGDFSRPLQLLARSVRFIDPLSQKEHVFESRLTLEMAKQCYHDH
ncbi:pseudouridine synthase [Basilea psittacipulmonis DSM 24701]|uniref:Pseudouridine synthase n=2 Tax=Basilea TaxID=1472344 RepID=A0A077DAN0_9BURK|nr:pseudouridine synthase [Basilea psittacipulmonis DSM 24701]